MNKPELIDWIVFHIDCNDCPVYANCRSDKPKTCREYIEQMFQACDAVTEQAVKNLVTQIRAKHTAMIRETDAARRRTLRMEWCELKRQLREVKDYIG